jgi:stalled ribosome rescue protein Dom34
MTSKLEWWMVDNDFKSNSTNEKRDDKIFEKISLKLNDLPPETTILVVCGSGHFHEQSERFIANGFVRKMIPNSLIFLSVKKTDLPIQTVWKMSGKNALTFMPIHFRRS